MKKLQTVFITLLASIGIAMIASCGEDSDSVVASIELVDQPMDVNNGELRIDPATNQLYFTGSLDNGGYLELEVEDSEPGIYTLGDTSKNKVTYSINNTLYTTANSAGYGVVDIKLTDRDKRLIELSFLATMVNTQNVNESIDLKKGRIKGNYSF